MNFRIPKKIEELKTKIDLLRKEKEFQQEKNNNLKSEIKELKASLDREKKLENDCKNLKKEYEKESKIVEQLEYRVIQLNVKIGLKGK